MILIIFAIASAHVWSRQYSSCLYASYLTGLCSWMTKILNFSGCRVAIESTQASMILHNYTKVIMVFCVDFVKMRNSTLNNQVVIKQNLDYRLFHIDII